MWVVLIVREILVALNLWLNRKLLIVTKVWKRRRRSQRGSPSASPTSPGRCPAPRTRRSRSPSPWTEWSCGEHPERETRRGGTVLTTWPEPPQPGTSEYSIQDSDITCLQEMKEQSQEYICNDSKYFFSVIIFVISSYCWCLPDLDSRFQILCHEAPFMALAIFILNIEKNLLLGLISVSKYVLQQNEKPLQRFKSIIMIFPCPMLFCQHSVVLYSCDKSWFSQPPHIILYLLLKNPKKSYKNTCLQYFICKPSSNCDQTLIIKLAFWFKNFILYLKARKNTQKEILWMRHF